MNTTTNVLAFATAARLIGEAVTVLRNAGQNPDNGYFGSVMMDLERIVKVCKGRGEGKEDAPSLHFTAPVAAPVAAPEVKKSNKRIIPALDKVKAIAQEVAAPAPKVSAPAPVTYPTSYKGVMALKTGIDAVAKSLDIDTAGMTYVNKCGAVWTAIKAATPAPAPKVEAAPAPKAAKVAKVKPAKVAKSAPQTVTAPAPKVAKVAGKLSVSLDADGTLFTGYIAEGSDPRGLTLSEIEKLMTVLADRATVLRSAK